jgi:hypothetical protein
MRRTTRPTARRLPRIAVLAVLVVGQLAPSVGWPAPRGPAKETGRPFPCQDRPCGCQSADDCWRSCCCFTAAERVAWAEENGVEVPDSLRAEAAGGPSCCGGDCCGSADCPLCSAKKKAAAAAKAKPTGRWTVGAFARSCRADGADWLHGPPTLRPAPPVRWSVARPLVDRVTTGADRPATIPFFPPTPPPR